ncbi:hypothetical protein BRD56_03520 [Thermoplasmatales archaeon SW_10_69_26]|nr:MAG: hypothetical protein BRD56_03520 [Thermoplasmatales archaeon SW_10_69_26]
MQFLQTRGVSELLVLALAIPVLLVVLLQASWVYADARREGFPAGPWLLAVLTVPGLGFLAYLVARGRTAKR